jgi:hypothetical protein
VIPPQSDPKVTGPVGGYGLDLPPGVGPEAYPGLMQGPADSYPAASLALACFGVVGGLCCFGQVASIAAVVVGLLALSSRPTPGTPGRGMAISAITIAVLTLMGWLVLLAVMLLRSSHP